jgi:Flp pilus assembly protein TadD
MRRMLGTNPNTGKAWIIWSTFLLLFLVGVWAAPAFSQTASPASSLTLHEVQLTGEGQHKRVSIQLSRPPTSIKSFSLASPPRIIIDVKGPTKGLPSATYRAQDELIKQVRVGYHEGYIRFVLDLKGKAIPTFSAKQGAKDAAVVTALLGEQGKISKQAAVRILFSHTGKRSTQRPRPTVVKKSAPAPKTRPKSVAQAPARASKRALKSSRPRTAAGGVLLPEIAPPPDARQVEMRPARQAEPVKQPEPATKPQTQLATKPQATPPKPSKATTPLEFPGTSFPPERRPSAPSSPSAEAAAKVRRSALLERPVSRTPKRVPPSPSQYSLLTQSNKTPSTRPAPPQYSLLDSSRRSQTIPSVAPSLSPQAPAETSRVEKAEKPVEKPLEKPQIAALAPQSRPKPPARAPAPPPVVATPRPAPEKSRSPNSLSREGRRHLGKGQILYDQGSVDEAIVEWRQTARLAPDNAKVHHLLGLALQDRGDQNEAITELNTSLRLDPENATAYVHLAQVLEAQGDVQAARNAYTKALKLVPTSAHVHNRLGHLLAAQEDWKGAAKEWQQTTELQPDYAYAYANLGEALERIEKKKEALEAYRQAVSLDPSAPFVAEVNQRITLLNAYGL